MPPEARSRVRVLHGPALDLPPPFRLVGLREAGDAFAHATRIAAAEGAGTLVHVGRFDLVEFALVLEPEEPLRTARRTIYACMNALADALAVHAPPETLISFEWPDAVFVEGALVGGGRLAWPEDAPEDAPPPWLVFGAMVRVSAMDPEEPGVRPGSSNLEDEGFEDLGTGRLIESFARHFMVAVDAWHEQGFGTVAKDYLSRLPTESGLRRDIDESGDLLLRRAPAPNVERRSLVDALAATTWLDRETGGPML